MLSSCKLFHAVVLLLCRAICLAAPLQVSRHERDTIVRFMDAFESSGEELSWSALRAFANGQPASAVPPPRTTLPIGPYNETCRTCSLDGQTLACECKIGEAFQFTSIYLESCENPVIITNRDGFLQCKWKDVPPPRVGAVQNPDVHRGCRLLAQTTFIAPQMMPSVDPITTRFVQTPEQCCDACAMWNREANMTVCRAWTLEGRACTLLRTSNTAYPHKTSVSGYPLNADSATFCTLSHYNTFDKGAVYDRSMAPDVSCRVMDPVANSSFPRAWVNEDHQRTEQRGAAWFFFPEQGGHCACEPRLTLSSVACTAPVMSTEDVRNIVTGKPWAVFVHGGRFVFLNALEQGYAQLASRVSAAGQLGVLAVDYRLAGPRGTPFPGGLLDVIEAIKWLSANGASSVYLYGDSSGGTQMMELMLYLTRHDRMTLKLISGAVGLSPWMDLTDSAPGYFANRPCDLGSSCATPVMWPSDPMFERVDGQCASFAYLPPSTPLTDSIASPFFALPSELAQLPPLLIIAGSNEVLLNENLLFVQKASAAGVGVQLEVWEWPREFECISSPPLSKTGRSPWGSHPSRTGRPGIAGSWRHGRLQFAGHVQRRSEQVGGRGSDTTTTRATSGEEVRDASTTSTTRATSRGPL